LNMVTEEANICNRCVGNSQLVHIVHGKGQYGKCAVCGRWRRYVVPFSALGSLLRNVAKIYAEVQDNYSAAGDLITDLLQADWDILAEDIVAKPKVVNETILALLDAGIHYDHDEDIPDKPLWTAQLAGVMLS